MKIVKKYVLNRKKIRKTKAPAGRDVQTKKRRTTRGANSRLREFQIKLNLRAQMHAMYVMPNAITYIKV